MKQYEKWMPLYIADYLADTSRLTLDQHGAYLLLIMDYWRNGAPPDDPVILARIVGASPEQWYAIAPVLHGLFHDEIRGGSKVWAHKRIDEELGRAKGISKIRAEVAANRHAKEHAKNMQLHTPLPSPSHIPSPEPSTRSKTLVANATLAEFREAWKRYPKRSGNNPKADALKAWSARIKEDVTPAAMLAGVDRYAAWCAATGKIGTETVMQAVRFFGKSRIFEQDFELPVKKANDSGPPWWASSEGIQTKAKELGVAPRTGESWADLKARVNAAMEA